MVPFLCLAILVIHVLDIDCQDAPRVHTKLGEIIGVLENDVNQFRNIPFAKPPIGNLRFAKPLQYGRWTGVLNGTEFGPSCIQPPVPGSSRFLPNLNQSEDCLSLNIYVPKDVSAGSNKSVMVWIYGGAYLVGQGMYYDASFLTRTGDVIVVTLNYRVGVFGFLSTMNDMLPGNYGLWDQRLALQWVNENIASFGGNPSSVTIFGQSAGGFSVSLQALNPMNKGLFQRVIAESGTSLSNSATWEYAQSFSQRLGLILMCAKTSGIDPSFLPCMQSVSAERLMLAQNQLLYQLATEKFDEIHSYLAPVVDKVLIPESPHDLLKNRSSASYQFFQSLDYMTGNVNQEGSLFIDRLALMGITHNYNLAKGVLSTVFCDFFVPIIISSFFGKTSNRTIPDSAVCSFYKGSSLSEQANKVLDAYADVIFIVPAIESLDKHSTCNSNSTTYQYIFNRPDPSANKSYPPWFVGSTHGAEIFFLFGLENFPSKYNISVLPTDLVLSQQMMKYWTNFAKTGNPNGGDLPTWKPYNSTNRAFMNLDTVVTPQTHAFNARVNFWLKATKPYGQSILFGK